MGMNPGSKPGFLGLFVCPPSAGPQGRFEPRFEPGFNPGRGTGLADVDGFCGASLRAVRVTWHGGPGVDKDAHVCIACMESPTCRKEAFSGPGSQPWPLKLTVAVATSARTLILSSLSQCL